MTINENSRILNAAVVTGAGTTLNLYDSYSTFTFNKTIAGVFSALVVNYEGSLDGTNWFQIGTDNAVTAGATFVVDKPVRYVRANVATFTGGTSVTVDVLPARYR
jgi:hypothetical protein